MAIREIVLGEKDQLLDRSHPILQKAAQASLGYRGSMDEVVRDLLDTMHSRDICIGLAAPQIGVTVSVAVVRDRVTPDGKDLILIDPVIVVASGKNDGKSEACMSLPGWYGLVKRKPIIEVEYLDLKGDPQRIRAEDKFARVIQHEVDHLNGIVFVQRLSSPDKLKSVEDDRVSEADDDRVSEDNSSVDVSASTSNAQ